MSNNYYQIDEVAKLTEMTKRTIRYYEDINLIKPLRTDAGYRLYTCDDIENIKEIRNLSTKLGMNLAQIQYFLGLRKNIHHILSGDIKDTDRINDTQNRLKDLLKLVDEREEILKRVKNNCSNYLKQLDNLSKEQSEDGI